MRQTFDTFARLHHGIKPLCVAFLAGLACLMAACGEGRNNDNRPANIPDPQPEPKYWRGEFLLRIGDLAITPGVTTASQCVAALGAPTSETASVVSTPNTNGLFLWGCDVTQRRALVFEGVGKPRVEINCIQRPDGKNGVVFSAWTSGGAGASLGSPVDETAALGGMFSVLVEKLAPHWEVAGALPRDKGLSAWKPALEPVFGQIRRIDEGDHATQPVEDAAIELSWYLQRHNDVIEAEKSSARPKNFFVRRHMWRVQANPGDVHDRVIGALCVQIPLEPDAWHATAEEARTWQWRKLRQQRNIGHDFRTLLGVKP